MKLFGCLLSHTVLQQQSRRKVAEPTKCVLANHNVSSVTIAYRNTAAEPPFCCRLINKRIVREMWVLVAGLLTTPCVSYNNYMRTNPMANSTCSSIVKTEAKFLSNWPRGSSCGVRVTNKKFESLNSSVVRCTHGFV